MLNYNQLYASERFNSIVHPIRIEVEGAVVLSGIARLDGYRVCDMASYTISIVNNTVWQLQILDNKPISQLFPDFEMTLTSSAIVQSWQQQEQLVRFLPVGRALYLPDYSTVSLLPPDQPLTTANYHPFLHLRSLITKIFEEIGYKIASDFFAEELFNFLYISGLYHEKDVDYLVEYMDFRAGRYEIVSAQANNFGYIYANPLVSYNSLGNIVETASSVPVNGKTPPTGLYDNGGCFIVDNQLVKFIPKQPVVVSMRYKLSFTTDYKIVSRSRLKGFDTIILGDNDVREFGIANLFEDHRANFYAGMTYRLVVFDALVSERFSLVATSVSTGNEFVITSFSGNSAHITLPSIPIIDLKLQKLNIQTMQLNDCPADWALYNGFIEYQGVTDVELDICGKPALVSPSNPKKFNDISFGGAWNGAKLTLRSAFISPIFEPHPTENTVIHWDDIVAHKFGCRTLLNAVNQMFNLVCQFDEPDKTVYIEPKESYYSSTEIDWTSKIELREPILLEQCNGEENSVVMLGYRSGDGAIRLINRELNDEFGAWRVENDSYFARPTQHTVRNVIFSATVNYDHLYVGAMSASLPMCGDIKEGVDRGLNFLPKIVKYQGMRQLPTGEHWGYPSFGVEYPYAAFHSPEEWTLCMENRDGCIGLNRFWINELEAKKRHRLTLFLRLDAVDLEPFPARNRLKRDWRGKFKFLISGEWSWWRLMAIEEWSPDTKLAKCLFEEA